MLVVLMESKNEDEERGEKEPGDGTRCCPLVLTDGGGSFVAFLPHIS